MGKNRNNHSSNDALISKIASILDTEVEKPYEAMDADLVYECVDFLMEMVGDEKRLTNEEIQENINDIPFVDENKSGKPAKGKRYVRRTFWVAACLVVIMLIANLVAMAFGTDIISVFKEWGSVIVNMAAGERIDTKEISIIKPNYSASYDTLEELLAAEGYSILYPTYLPDGYTVQSVTYIEFDKKREVAYFTGSADVSIQVTLDGQLADEEIQNTKTIEIIAGYTCYMVSDAAFAQARFIYNGNVYTVKTNSVDHTVKIIENLKE